MATRRKQSRRPFGMVRELLSGRFQASYLSDGQRVNAPQTFTTVADARAWLSTVETDRLRGTLKARPRVRETLGEYAARWVKQRPGLRESTRRQDELSAGGPGGSSREPYQPCGQYARLLT